jgi:hypothetical protein
MTIDRRSVVIAGCAAGAVWAGAATASAPATYRLQTRLVNFKSELSSVDLAAAIARFKATAAEAGLSGLLAGQNLNATPFPTRFEWLFMTQAPGPHSESGAPAKGLMDQAWSDLMALTRNHVRCDVVDALPDRYAAAEAVGVRHVVMFSFKPTATAQARARNVAAIRKMGELPMVRRYRVDQAAAGGDDPDRMEWQVVGDFASLADFRAYADAPMHLAIREDFNANTARVAFIDVAL